MNARGLADYVNQRDTLSQALWSRPTREPLAANPAASHPDPCQSSAKDALRRANHEVVQKTLRSCELRKFKRSEQKQCREMLVIGHGNTKSCHLTRWNTKKLGF